MLLSTVNPEAAAAIGAPRKVGVANVVLYHARAGYMRDRRSEFPALVMRQHVDGSLDLLVFMEREDFAFEEHVHFQSHNQPHHCWSEVEQLIERVGPEEADEGELACIQDAIAVLTERVAVIEARKVGRPRKVQPSKPGSAQAEQD